MKSFRFVRAALCVAALALHSTPNFAADVANGETVHQAEDVSRTIPRTIAAFQIMLATQNLCLGYSYDQNGNRTTQVTSDITSQPPTWGTGSYPCFTWSAP
jgi:hypothetical protein